MILVNLDLVFSADSEQKVHRHHLDQVNLSVLLEEVGHLQGWMTFRSSHLHLLQEAGTL